MEEIMLKLAVIDGVILDNTLLDSFIGAVKHAEFLTEDIE